MTEKILQCDHVTKTFGGLVAVNEVSFTMNKGEIKGLIGPNGAGKTTLFNLISGVFKPNQGTVTLFGENVTGLSPNRMCKKGIGRTFQITKPFPGLSVHKTVAIGALNRTNSVAEANDKADEVLHFVGLYHKRGNLGSNLSVIERKRLEVARAIATDPRLLMLDEVVAGLSPSEVNEIIKLIFEIKDKGISIIIIEHVLQALMKVSDTIVVLNYGKKIAEGTPMDISKNEEVIEAYLGEDYKVANSGSH
ncbi:ABC transporter ATP-binding protein [Bacillus sp. JJ1773]|uniref:ABC transporter ATP-binding protein n=1 Tax=Bacillus sp. JJ1773 TaxID=3122965 RepID=UPI002FFE2146